MFLCIIRGSSPLIFTEVLSLTIIGFFGDEPPYPLETIPGLYPLLSKSFASHITIGVFPVPPTTTFPTTTTGTSGFHDKLG